MRLFHLVNSSVPVLVAFVGGAKKSLFARGRDPEQQAERFLFEIRHVVADKFFACQKSAGEYCVEFRFCRPPWGEK